MLRRQPTKIGLVQDDIVAYDNHKLARDSQKRKQEAISNATSGDTSLFDNTFNHSEMFVRKDVRSRDQRIGTTN